MESTVTLRERRFELYIPESAIHQAIASMAEIINRDYAEAERPLLLVTLNGAFIFAGELFRQLDGDFEVAFIKLSSYGHEMASSGSVTVDVPLTAGIKGRDIIIAEDVVDTGNTIRRLNTLLTEQGARSIRVATLILKPEVYYSETARNNGDLVPIDYVALESEPRFIIGYGMDCDGLGRNLGAIYALIDEQ